MPLSFLLEKSMLSTTNIYPLQYSKKYVRSSSWKIFLFMATLFYCQNQFRGIAKADAVIHLLPIEANTSVCMLVVLLKYISHKKSLDSKELPFNFAVITDYKHKILYSLVID